MDQSNTYNEQEYQAQANISPEFGSWPCDPEKLDTIVKVKTQFDELLHTVKTAVPNYNGRYTAMVTTKLEEACMLAVKGISRPQ